MPDRPLTEAAITAADAYVPAAEALFADAYLISRGVRPLTLTGHCPADELTVTRVRTLLSAGRRGLDVIVYVVTGEDGNASFGYAAHGWAVNLLRWAVSGGIPPARTHEILGLLLGYSAAAISRHQEADDAAV